jgi:hypothetical protein
MHLYIDSLTKMERRGFILLGFGHLNRRVSRAIDAVVALNCLTSASISLIYSITHVSTLHEQVAHAAHTLSTVVDMMANFVSLTVIWDNLGCGRVGCPEI